MPYSAGGRWVPAPGQTYAPRVPRLADGAWTIPKGSELNFMGLRIELPERASVKIDSRAGRAWVRSAGHVAQFTPQGRETVTPEGQRLLLESWDSL